MSKTSADSIVRAQVIPLSDAGLSQVQISRQPDISRHCVQNIIKEYNDTGQYNDLQRKDCPEKFYIVIFGT